ncbi:twin transmembrane helix small protein [uncultured Sphingomonas sp.]|uniref:twin transmembrane helix small protein n=1 Tax=uncultured Sphingomonas sp. TaxID=158754 RepID=UPI0025F64475|nr:twin transmembrane helix small protein [uncultured Sphingomonas sp.]
MNTFLVLLLIAAMIAVVVALIRGIVSFLAQGSAEVRGEGPSDHALKSNKMMQARVLFQAIAILIVVVLLFLSGRS